MLVENLKWGLYKKISILVVDHGEPRMGDLVEFKKKAIKYKKSVIQAEYPGPGNSYGKNSEPLYKDASHFYENHLKNFSQEINFDNLLILHGNKGHCWAFNAEFGSMSAFGGPVGEGYSHCRGGDEVKKRFHLYLFISEKIN